MRVNVARLNEIFKELEAINNERFGDLEFYDGDQKIEIDPKVIEDYRFLGLCNTSFVEMGFHTPEGQKEFLESDIQRP